jgi:hypothetical protein
VAHVAVTSAATVDGWLLTHRHSRREISERLLHELDERPQWHDLRSAWMRLAQIRRPFSEELLAETVGTLSNQSDELMRRCLLYQAGAEYVLHETLRREAYKKLSAEDGDWAGGQLHALAEHYNRVARNDRPDDGTPLVAAMEGFYYAARAGARHLVEEAPFFVDQLDLLGKTLSYDHRDYLGAAEVFDRAVVAPQVPGESARA